jgi:IS30 family transposase
MSYHHLTMGERNVIHNLQMFGQSQAKIARCLGRSPTTIGRELKRNPNFSGQYLPDIAQIKANADQSQRSAPGLHLPAGIWWQRNSMVVR